MHCQPIGLDIGSSSIKMIQLAINGEQVKIVAADKVRIDPDIDADAETKRNFIVSSIKQMLTENDFHGRNVVSHLPSDDVKITSLRLAQEDEEKIEQALRREAAVRFGLDVGRDAVDHLVAGAVQQGDEVKNELILFAASDQAIRAHIKMLEEANLRPVGIDTVPFALFRSSGRFLRRQEDKERTVVFVDVGSRYTTVVFGRGGEISFVKQIPVGGEKFNQQIASKLGIGVKEAEMLRGTLRMEKASSTLPAPAALPCTNCVVETAVIANESSEPEATEQSGTVKTASAVDVRPEQNNAGLDSVTRQAIISAISTVAQELIHEVSLCFKYYTVTFRGKRVERAIITGGEAYEGILLDVMRQQLGVEIEIGQPLRGFDVADVEFDGLKRGLLCEWAVAVGLGLKGWQMPLTVAGEEHEPQIGKRAIDSGDNYEGN